MTSRSSSLPTHRPLFRSLLLGAILAVVLAPLAMATDGPVSTAEAQTAQIPTDSPEPLFLGNGNGGGNGGDGPTCNGTLFGGSYGGGDCQVACTDFCAQQGGFLISYENYRLCSCLCCAE